MRSLPYAVAALGLAALCSTLATSAATTLNYTDRRDFEAAERGFIASLADGAIKNAAGAVVYDYGGDDILQGAAPPTVHPSLWRQGQL
ncbi:MAG: MBL fold metallo-hydrolase, partial [Steroidobacteraceae bacterium]